MGVFGQNLFIDRKSQIVIAKLSSHAHPMDDNKVLLTMRGIEALRGHLRASQAA
jgi:hypothetical protein